MRVQDFFSPIVILISYLTMSPSESLATTPPPEARAFYSQGVAAMDRADWEQAITVLSRAIELAPDWEQPYYTRACAWEKKRQWKKSIDDFTVVIRLYPKGVDAYIKPLTYQKIGERNKAFQDVDKARSMCKNQSSCAAEASSCMEGKPIKQLQSSIRC